MKIENKNREIYILTQNTFESFQLHVIHNTWHINEGNDWATYYALEFQIIELKYLSDGTKYDSTSLWSQ